MNKLAEVSAGKFKLLTTHVMPPHRTRIFYNDKEILTVETEELNDLKYLASRTLEKLKELDRKSGYSSEELR